MTKAARIADKAADRIEDQIDDANITSATVAFGVATEKVLLLAGDPTAILEVNPGPGFADLYEKLNAMRPGNVPDPHEPKQTRATVIEPVTDQPASPSRETISDSGAENGSQPTKKTSKKIKA